MIEKFKIIEDFYLYLYRKTIIRLGGFIHYNSLKKITLYNKRKYV